MNQHLIRSIVAIRQQGGVLLGNGDRVVPDPILVGRNDTKVAALAKAHSIERWTTDLDAALANRDDTVFFDSASTGLRPSLVNKAIAAGKHVYMEKPVAPTAGQAIEMMRNAREKGVKHGVVQDKLWLPGLLKLKMLIDSGFFGTHPRRPRRVRLLGVRRRLAAGAASVVELQEGRRRRDHRRHAVPLALRDRQPVWRR
jgi:predicted dehydrogenase